MTLAQAIAVLCGLAVPFIVDTVTKSNAPRWLKSAIAAALAALAGAVTTVTVTPGQRWTTYVGAIAAAWVVALATHYTGATNGVQRVTATFGVGPAKQGRDKPGDPLLAAVRELVDLTQSLVRAPYLATSGTRVPTETAPAEVAPPVP